VPFSGPYVDFGSYPEAVYNSERSRDIILSFEMNVEESLSRMPRAITRQVSFGPTTTIEIKLHWNAKSGQAQFNSIKMYNGESDELLFQFRRLGPESIRMESPLLGFHRTVSDASELNLTTIRSLPLEIGPDPGSEARLIELFTFALTLSLNDSTRRIQHIGPLRDMPERAYRLDQLSTSGGSTEHLVGMLVSHPDVVSRVSRALRRLNIARQIDVVSPAPGFAGVVLSSPDSPRRDNLADVGFGASQVLPIIVRLALARQRSMLLIEQPELHLHPEVQADLVDVMIDLARQRKCSLLVESHSENMLLRIRRKIASRQLSPSDVKIFVTDSGKVREAPIDEKGRIEMSAFPLGFFEEEWFEAMGIIEGGARSV